MNRRDYKLVAQAIKDMTGDVTPFVIQRVTAHFIQVFDKAEGCAGFDKVRFAKACGIVVQADA